MKALIITDFHRGWSKYTADIHDEVYPFIDSTLFDCIIVSGDWGTSDLKHVEGAFIYLRKIFPNKDIIGVLGNHDFWNRRSIIVQDKYKIINYYAKNNKIILLENNRYDYLGYTFLGFNGWFEQYEEGRAEAKNWFATSRDLLLLKQNEAKAFEYIINQKTSNRNKTIIISHFPIFKESFEGIYDNGNPVYRSHISQKARFFIFGHTHHFFYDVLDNTIVINVGAKQDTVNYSIYDFDNEKFISHFDKSILIK